MDSKNGGGCPFAHGGNTTTKQPVTKWWPTSLNLDILHQQPKVRNGGQQTGGITVV